MEAVQHATYWRSDNLYALCADGRELFVGSRLTPPYEATVASHTATAEHASGRVVFCNHHLLDGPVYDPAIYEAEFDVWAWMIYPTVLWRSAGSFHCLNVYEDGSANFGLMQEPVHDDYAQLVYEAQHSETYRRQQVNEAVKYCKQILQAHLSDGCSATIARLVYECLQCTHISHEAIQQALMNDNPGQCLLSLLSALEPQCTRIITAAHSYVTHRLQPYHYSSLSNDLIIN